MLMIDPATIADPALRAVITTMMNHIDALEERVRQQKEEIQRLRDENNRLRGEQGQPIVLPSKPPQDLSSDTERAERLPRPPRRGPRAVRITDERRLPIDPTSLPPDAVFKGYQPVIVQDLVVQAQGIRFLREKWYAPSSRRSYLAPLPPGFRGHFGPRLKALALTLYFDSGLSMAKLHAFLGLAGVAISTGQVSHLLTGDRGGHHHPPATADGGSAQVAA